MNRTKDAACKTCIHCRPLFPNTHILREAGCESAKHFCAVNKIAVRNLDAARCGGDDYQPIQLKEVTA